MKISALLDVNVVAHETEDEVTVLLSVEAPAAPPEADRPPASLEVVLDRSGSMSGAPLDGAKRALAAVVRRLEPTDNFGLVSFDDSAQVAAAAGPLTDKDHVIRLINGVQPGGMTDLSAGYLRGLREIRRVAGKAGGTVLIISDGHVNSGIKSVAEFAAITSKSHREGIVTSSLGYGREYDETLLVAIARSGSGNHVFADNPDAAGAAIAAEVNGLLAKAVQGLSLTVRLEPSVEILRLYNDLPTQQTGPGEVMIEVGDLYGGEARKVLLKFKVPAMAALGLARVATLELAHVELPALTEQRASVPVMVNVVPGDEAAGRVPDPVVHSQKLFQEAQEAKLQASEAYERGRLDEGQRLMGETRSRLNSSLEAAPDALKPEIQAEIADVERMLNLGENATSPSTQRLLSKRSRSSYYASNAQSGRNDYSPDPVDRSQDEGQPPQQGQGPEDQR